MSADAGRDPRWWRRPGPSLLVLLGVVVVVAAAVVSIGGRVADTLPEVGRDDTGSDTWRAPLAVQELNEEVVLGVVPDCAAGPITRIVLWDPESEPYWEVSGPARPVQDFFVGFPIEGFSTDVEFRRPPDDELVRLIVFRRVGSPAGVRFRYSDIANGRLMGGSPLRSYTRDGWLSEAECTGPGGGTGDSDAPEPTGESGDPADPDDPDSVPGGGDDGELPDGSDDVDGGLPDGGDEPSGGIESPEGEEPPSGGTVTDDPFGGG